MGFRIEPLILSLGRGGLEQRRKLKSLRTLKMKR